ncbi:MAG TPA: zinc ribbon domain-containing protein, partial [Polyangia bacterium]
MRDLVRCPHCKAELPEKASFCANCGRRIEGWTVPKDATPAMGEAALPGGDDKTRQMEPTPSLLRAAAVSVKKQGARKRRAVGLPLVLGMLVVAVAGGLGAFFLVRARVKKNQPSAVSHPPSAPVAVAPPLVKPPAPVVAAAPPAPPKMLVRKNKQGKRAHVIASAPVPVKARKSSSGGLPHKQVATDSKPLTMPTVQHETTGESGAPPPPAPQSEADDKQEAEAGVD